MYGINEKKKKEQSNERRPGRYEISPVVQRRLVLRQEEDHRTQPRLPKEIGCPEAWTNDVPGGHSKRKPLGRSRGARGGVRSDGGTEHVT
jgi:hypothetical protein